MQKQTDFELVGHDCPLGHYPAPLVPIGSRNGEYIAVYLDSDKSEPHCEPIPDNAEFVHHSNILKESLQAFDYRKDKLFGLSDNNVIFYAAADEKDFFLKLLKNESFSANNVFFRLSLAKATENTSQIEYELRRCIQYLKLDDAAFIPSWYQTQKDQLSSLWRKKLGQEFPHSQQLIALNPLGLTKQEISILQALVASNSYPYQKNKDSLVEELNHLIDLKFVKLRLSTSIKLMPEEGDLKFYIIILERGRRYQRGIQQEANINSVAREQSIKRHRPSKSSQNKVAKWNSMWMTHIA